jgi:hypothetical protein
LAAPKKNHLVASVSALLCVFCHSCFGLLRRRRSDQLRRKSELSLQPHAERNVGRKVPAATTTGPAGQLDATRIGAPVRAATLPCSGQLRPRVASTRRPPAPAGGGAGDGSFRVGSGWIATRPYVISMRVLSVCPGHLDDDATLRSRSRPSPAVERWRLRRVLDGATACHLRVRSGQVSWKEKAV